MKDASGSSFRFGVDYYPEQWPRERWPRDVELMEEAGINVVRMAEFAWARMEPDEGAYDFAWLDEVVERLGRRGIQTVLCTPTATPPAWLIQKHPDILPVDRDGRTRHFGSRRHYCVNSPVYRKEAVRITRLMAERYRRYPDVIGWQIDNEFGCHATARCYCDHCAEAWREWLQRRHESLDALNRAWGTVFWSQTYSDWNQIPLPRHTVTLHNVGLRLDHYRFVSKSHVDFQRLQIDVLKEQNPGWFVTHNMVGEFGDLDYLRLAADLDLVSWDNYPGFLKGSDWIQTALYHDLFYALKQHPYWVMEQQAGLPGWENEFGRSPRPGQIRLWSFQSLAHGADGILFFRWRTARFGAEQDWHGILDHHGQPCRRYDEVRQAGRELGRIGPVISPGRKWAKVGILFSFENAWMFEIQPYGNFEGGLPGAPNPYVNQLYLYYRQLQAMNVPVAFAVPGADLSDFELVIAPSFSLGSEAVAEKLEGFVSSGGHLVMSFRSGLKNSSNAVVEDRLPGVFAELMGIRVKEYDALVDGARVPVSGVGELEGLAGKSSFWMDVLETTSARPLIRYSADCFKGQPAAAVNDYGAGKAYYLGTQLEESFLGTVLRRVLQAAGAGPVVSAPDGVEVALRQTAKDLVLFLLNHNDGPVSVDVTGWASAGGDETSDRGRTEVRLEPYDVRLFPVELSKAGEVLGDCLSLIELSS